VSAKQRKPVVEVANSERPFSVVTGCSLMVFGDPVGNIRFRP